ncbi:AsmA-like C-terminal region-containing protein [Paludisphaera sp.]|uniref:AsmA-like C-terminal region-containing protein n=1 Tax=Paludisphaera sp. TaxID=2017432 RepID=UPI00301D718D
MRWRRVARFLFWSATFGLILAAGAAWFAYSFVTDGDTVARMLQAKLREFFPRAEFEFGRVDFQPLRGRATLKNLVATQSVDGEPFPSISIAWLGLRFDPWKLLEGKREVSEVVVSRPTLRLVRKKDGAWNLVDLPASPWPRTPIENPPPVDIVNGTVELVVDPEAAPPPAAAGAVGPGVAAILRDVSLKIRPAEGNRLGFEGTARGDLFGRVELSGSVDPDTGDVDLRGRLVDLTISDTLRRRLPGEAGEAFDALALKSGDVDVELASLALRPNAPPEAQLAYDLKLQLRDGSCRSTLLPFPLDDLSARVGFDGRTLTIEQAEGSNGATRIRVSGRVEAGDPASAPLAIHVEADDLDLDDRLKARTPEEFLELWDVFRPKGRVDLKADLAREAGGPIAASATARLKDVSALYRHFKYPLKNLTGTLTLEGSRMTVDVRGPIGDRPARLHGTVDEPGHDAVVDLTADAESLPIDAAFLDALPDDVRRWVDMFKPAGAAEAHARILRRPLAGPPPPPGWKTGHLKPEGLLAVHSTADLDPERCEITWEGMPFPIRRLGGRLELHPDHWIFKNMVGRNGQALITGSGRVDLLAGPDLPNGDPPLRIVLGIAARNLPFSPELRDALQPAWRKSWEVINPDGSCDVDAAIEVEAHKPDHVVVAIAPLPGSQVRLVVPRAPGPGVEADATTELRMQDVLGAFRFVDGTVGMRDVKFTFHGAPVEFREGAVRVEDSGKFALKVVDLRIRDLLLNAGLRRVMPPLMAQFALRLDDGKPFTAWGDLEIGWDGDPNSPAWCAWEKTQVFFLDNKLMAGVPLEHVNGKFKDVHGRSDGRSLEVHGTLDVASVKISGIPLADLQGPLVIKDGQAALPGLTGKVLGGEARGEGWITLSESPRYAGSARISGADLQKYAATLPGRQSFRGLVDARIEFNGQGNDARQIQGAGAARVVDGDIGELPFVLTLVKGLNKILAPNVTRGRGKALFDSADVAFKIVNGTTFFERFKLTGDAVSLNLSDRGRKNTRDPFDKIDLSFDVAYGRNERKVPVISALMREAGAGLLQIDVLGTMAQPQAKPRILPSFTGASRD